MSLIVEGKKILITGGAGTLGRAIIKRSVEEKWDCGITIFSRDAIKHAKIRAEFPHVQSVIGDIRDPNTLYNVMTGKDIVIHAAAVKHIPVSEVNSIDTYEVNVQGSLNVCAAAAQLGVPHVLGISTDKACHAANAYGATKYLMEKIFQEYARLGLQTNYHLTRYGNVLESTGSVIEAWKRSVEAGRPIQITDSAMTRFFISPKQAAGYVLDALDFESGQIYIPQMQALSIGKLAIYTVGDEPFVRVPLRPGEKTHETLLTWEETHYAQVYGGDYFLLNPTTSERHEDPEPGAWEYTSDKANELSKEELLEMLNG